MKAPPPMQCKIGALDDSDVHQVFMCNFWMGLLAEASLMILFTGRCKFTCIAERFPLNVWEA